MAADFLAAGFFMGGLFEADFFLKSSSSAIAPTPNAAKPIIIHLFIRIDCRLDDEALFLLVLLLIVGLGVVVALVFCAGVLLGVAETVGVTVAPDVAFKVDRDCSR